VHDLDVLLPAISAGDVAAFGRFVAGAEPPLRASLRRFAVSVDTEAVLQEVLLRLWQLAPRFVPDDRPNAFLRFAHRACRNLCVDELRRRHGVVPDEAQVAEAAVPANPPDPLLRRAIHDCAERLPTKPARALQARLRCTSDEPDARLAARLDMTLNTFLQNFTRARKLLGECLEKRGVDLDGLYGAHGHGGFAGLGGAR